MRRWLAAGLLAALAGAPVAGAGQDRSALGVVRSDAKVEVKARVGSPIRQLPAQEGDVVRAGTLLVEMANERERAEVAAAQSELQRAESAVAETELRLDIARRELERNLKVPDLITARDLDLARDQVRVAEAELRTRRDDVARARSALAVAVVNLDDTMIRAPFDAVVSRVYLREGATPRPAETSILDVVALDRLYVEVALPLPLLPRVRQGMRAGVTVEDEHSAVKAVTTATVRHVYPEVDTTTRMFRVKLDLDRGPARILPGMFARVDLPVSPAGRTGR